MAYKALADKLRIAMEISEPDTLDGFLELDSIQVENSVDGAPAFGMPEAGKQGDESTHAGEGLNAIRDGRGKARGARLRVCFRPPVASQTESVRGAYLTLFPDGFPGTMAAVEEAVRARLGQTWMHRGARRPIRAQGHPSGQTVA